MRCTCEHASREAWNEALEAAAAECDVQARMARDYLYLFKGIISATAHAEVHGGTVALTTAADRIRALKRPRTATERPAGGDDAPAATGQPPSGDAAPPPADARHPSIANMGNRVTMAGGGEFDEVSSDGVGELDEVVTDGGCHLERLSKKRWFLNCLRADGSSYAVWFRGKVTLTEERLGPEAIVAHLKSRIDALEALQSPEWPSMDGGVDG